MTDIKNLRKKLEQQKGRMIELQSNISKIKSAVRTAKNNVILYEKAHEVIKAVGLKTQQQLQYHVSNITSLALSSVFADPYSLEIEFIERRNKNECDIYFVRGESKVDPLSSSGIGAVDVAAFALRIAIWSMRTPRTRNVIILDEPFKHLRGRDENLQMLEMIHTISQTMGIQIIMVADERLSREDIVERVDRVFDVSIKKRISKVVTS